MGERCLGRAWREEKDGRRRGASVGFSFARWIKLYNCSAGRADSCSILPIGTVCVSVVTPLRDTHTLALNAPPEPSANCRPSPLPLVTIHQTPLLSRTKSASCS